MEIFAGVSFEFLFFEVGVVFLIIVNNRHMVLKLVLLVLNGYHKEVIIIIFFQISINLLVFFKGLYITGGLTPRNIDLIRRPGGPFLHAFKDKGRVSFVLDTIPVYAVMIDDVGQRGAHRVAYLDYYDHTATSSSPSSNSQTVVSTANTDTNNSSSSSCCPRNSQSSGCPCTNCPFTPLLGLAAIVSLTFYAIARYR